MTNKEEPIYIPIGSFTERFANAEERLSLMKYSQLNLSIKSVCGRSLIYPMCEKSKELAKIARTGTLLFESIPHIQKLGFDIQWEGLTQKDEDRLRELGVGNREITK